MASALTFDDLLLCRYIVRSRQTLVLVSVAPYKYLVERIAGDTVNVGLLVPPAANVAHL